MHLDGLDLSGQGVGDEGDHHTRLDDTCLDTTNRHCFNTADFVDVLEGQTKGLVGMHKDSDVELILSSVLDHVLK